MQRIKITIMYDGSNYSGWQIQNNAITIQEEVELACSRLFSQEIKVIGASRTDAGVHAYGQVAVFDVLTSIHINRIPYGLNAYLPKDIVVCKAEEVNNDFHPRYDAKLKIYEYRILNTQFNIPQNRNISYFYSVKMDIQAMLQACKYFVGEHDFKSFCAAKSSVKSTIRTIYECTIIKESHFLVFKICGNGFLYNMVRIIIGTLIQVGIGKLKPEEISSIIEAKDRKYAGETAPAKGLTLLSIKY